MRIAHQENTTTIALNSASHAQLEPLAAHILMMLLEFADAHQDNLLIKSTKSVTTPVTPTLTMTLMLSLA
jgi:hypothetical protein